MRILVFGADGFIGRHVVELLADKHEMLTAARTTEKGAKYAVDLTNKESVATVLAQAQPDVVINSAGIVTDVENANQNVLFTENILTSIMAQKLTLKRIIICGSAAEYGIVDPKNIPVNESTPLQANTLYGQSKVRETTLALEYRDKHGLPISIARIFNPIGVGMHPKFLIPQLIRQVREIQDGTRQSIEVSRLNARRDYIDIKDVATALKILAEGNPKEAIYNVGSGKSTSNKELVELIISSSRLHMKPDIVETSLEDEPLLAIQADISRIKQELGWEPRRSIEETIKEIIDATRQ